MSRMALVLVALLPVVGCGGGNSCKKACDKVARCLGIGDGGAKTASDAAAPAGWTCPLSKECTPLEKCQADCINKADCEAFTSPLSTAGQSVATCQAQCKASPKDGGGESVATTDFKQPMDMPWNVDMQQSDTVCQPVCEGKQCGSDGCGGSCGTCQSPAVCDANGRCTGGGCGAITLQGCCTGEILSYCENGQLNTLDCAQSPSCGWSAANSFYDCNTDGGADPSGTYLKACP